MALSLNLTHTTQSSEKICKLQKCMKFSETVLELFLKETTYTWVSWTVLDDCYIYSEIYITSILKTYENSLRYNTTFGVFVATQILSLVKIWFTLWFTLVKINVYLWDTILIIYLAALSLPSVALWQMPKLWSLKSLWKKPKLSCYIRKRK